MYVKDNHCLLNPVGMDYITYHAGKHKLSHDIKKDSKLKIKYHAFSNQNPLAKEVRNWMFHKWKAV